MQFPSQFIALLRLLLSVSGTVPGGIVVFFPSFAMLQSFVAVADAGGSAAASTAPSIVEELRRRGPLLVEKRMPGATKFKAGRTGFACAYSYYIMSVSLTPALLWLSWLLIVPKYPRLLTAITPAALAYMRGVQESRMHMRISVQARVPYSVFLTYKSIFLYAPAKFLVLVET